MATYTKLIYHIIFATKNRKKAIPEEHKRELYKYIYGVLKNHQSHVYRINGMEEHIHILTSLHTTKSVSKVVKDIKISSNQWMKKRGLFPDFEEWQVGYGIFTVSEYNKNGLIEYIKNQEKHHNTETFEEEFQRLLAEHGVKFEEKYLW